MRDYLIGTIKSCKIMGIDPFLCFFNKPPLWQVSTLIWGRTLCKDGTIRTTNVNTCGGTNETIFYTRACVYCSRTTNNEAGSIAARIYGDLLTVSVSQD